LLGAEAARRLAAVGVAEIAPGLAVAEFARVEAECGFEFADEPVDGVLFDVDWNELTI
jgi:hypothetical protein